MSQTEYDISGFECKKRTPRLCNMYSSYKSGVHRSYKSSTHKTVSKALTKFISHHTQKKFPCKWSVVCSRPLDIQYVAHLSKFNKT